MARKRKSKLKKGCGCLLAGFLTIAVIIAAVTFVMKPRWHDRYGERFVDVAYGSRPHNTYDLFLPNNAAATDSLALILYIHGGSWIGGNKSDHLGDCYKWVQKGYATATMNYSLLKDDSVSIQTMLDEIDQCVAHIARFTRQHGTPVCQMAVAGTSAGGHLAMMHAYSRQHPLPLRFAAIKVGPADFRILFPYQENSSDKDLRNFVYSVTGQQMNLATLTREQVDSIKLQGSPIAYITDSTAIPTIFAYGAKDQLITPEHYRALQAKYDALGKKYSLIVYPNSGHMLLHDAECSERYDSTLNAYCKTYFGY